MLVHLMSEVWKITPVAFSDARRVCLLHSAQRGEVQLYNALKN